VDLVGVVISWNAVVEGASQVDGTCDPDGTEDVFDGYKSLMFRDGMDNTDSTDSGNRTGSADSTDNEKGGWSTASESPPEHMSRGIILGTVTSDFLAKDR